MKLGAFTFLLHSHIPYCRQAGRWPHGEEWLHEAASGTYLPLLLALLSLRERGIPFRLTITMTPVLLEQLADPLIREHLEEFLKDKVRRAEEDIKRLEKEEHRARLARLRRDDAALTLATAHATKGLEFDHVAVIGLDEGRFPSARSVAEAEDPARALEEERRLAYVAWTRARRSLTLVYDPDAPSTFLREAFEPWEIEPAA